MNKNLNLLGKLILISTLSLFTMFSFDLCFWWPSVNDMINKKQNVSVTLTMFNILPPLIAFTLLQIAQIWTINILIKKNIDKPILLAFVALSIFIILFCGYYPLVKMLINSQDWINTPYWQYGRSFHYISLIAEGLCFILGILLLWIGI